LARGRLQPSAADDVGLISAPDPHVPSCACVLALLTKVELRRTDFLAAAAIREEGWPRREYFPANASSICAARRGCRSMRDHSLESKDNGYPHGDCWRHRGRAGHVSDQKAIRKVHGHHSAVSNLSR